MLYSQRLLSEKVLKHVCRTLKTIKSGNTGVGVLFYSKRSNFENYEVYKVVKARKAVDGVDEFSTDINSNWELLSPQGYRFYLPGNIGPAWHDQYSTAQHTEFDNLVDGSARTSPSQTLECVAQVCPLLLRKGVFEMFPAINDLANSQLTIVTLSQKSLRRLSAGEIEQENQVKTFVLVAQEICLKLNLAGYWADFINPFSGRPYLSATYKTPLYKTDERFRCLGFEITVQNNCKVINSQQTPSRKFVGSLFTTAPANMILLKSILNKYED